MTRGTDERLLDMLGSPRPVLELANALGITPQAVHKQLSRLVLRDRVRVVQLSRGKVRRLFVRRDVESSGVADILDPRHDSAPEMILRRLEPGHFYSLADLEQAVPVKAAAVHTAVARLSREGFVQTLKAAGRRLCLLAPEGARRRGLIGPCEPAEPVDLPRILGPCRTQIITALVDLREADLGTIRRHPSGFIEDRSSVEWAKAIRSLQNDDLLNTSAAFRPRRHSLTGCGTLLAEATLLQQKARTQVILRR